MCPSQKLPKFHNEGALSPSGLWLSLQEGSVTGKWDENSAQHQGEFAGSGNSQSDRFIRSAKGVVWY
jgi:hypothetical protein